MLIALLGFAALFTLALAGLPLGFTMAVVGLAGFAWYRGAEPAFAMAAQQVVDIGMSYGLTVIPLFVLMGSFIFKAGVANDLFSTAQRWLGGMRGGLAHASLGACAGFGAVCGSSLATAATMTRVAVPEMRRYGYDDAFSGATIAAGGTIGILIPPSVPMVIYGILTETDIGKLFAAGVIPGIALTLLYMAAVWLTARTRPQVVGQVTRSTWAERFLALRGLLPAGLLFTFVFGGLYLGIFTPTESAGLGAAGALGILAMRGRATLQTLREALSESVELTAVILPVTIGAGIFTNFLTMTGLTQNAATWVGSLDVSPLTVVVLMCVIYLMLGCVFDGLAMIFLTIPIFYPIIVGLGLDPVWFGVIVVIVVELGLITPPMGMNVFVVKSLLPEVNTWRMFANIGGFVVAALACLALVIYFPAMALWLPSMMK
ncbi:MAG: TRAP transporter large permease [Lautropia sp.]